MADFAFQGANAVTLDGKWRLTFPSRHRKALEDGAGNALTITKHPDGCLLVFPRPSWETFRDKVAALPMEAAGWKRVFLGNAMDLQLDSAARVLISPELRAAGGLQRDVTLYGMGSHFELWDPQRYAAHEAVVLQQGLPEALRGFSY